jgi:hypothetical protein
MENQALPQFLKDAYCDIDRELNDLIEKFDFSYKTTDYDSLDDNEMIDEKKKEILRKYFNEALGIADSKAQKNAIHEQNKTESFDTLKELFETYIKKQKYRFETRAGMTFN